jgi:hypothetical protein
MPTRDLKRFPTLITWTDPNGKTHVPPDPPLREGYPPWMPRPNEYELDEPLAKCPDLNCRRKNKCVSLIVGKYCRKTHMEPAAFRAKLAEKVERIARELGVPEEPPLPPGVIPPPPPPEMKRILQERCDELRREALLEFQTGWIEEQKKAWAKKEAKRKVRV